MASLADVFGPNHNIGTSTTGNPTLFFSDVRTIPSITRLRDLSGSLINAYDELGKQRNKLIDLDTSALDADDLVCKYKAHKMAYDMNTANVAEIEKKLKDLDTHKEDYLRQRNSYHNYMLSMSKITPEIYDTLMKYKHDLHEQEERIRGIMIEELTFSLKECKEDLEINLANMNKFREFVSIGLKSLVSTDKIKQHFCPICLEKEVDKCIVPCGHTFCEGCINKSMGSLGSMTVWHSDTQTTVGKCPTCRGNIEKTIPFFLS
jgi:hypothetical protein